MTPGDGAEAPGELSRAEIHEQPKALERLLSIHWAPATGRAILDAGSKALSSDRGPDDGFGVVVEARLLAGETQRGARLPDARRR